MFTRGRDNFTTIWHAIKLYDALSQTDQDVLHHGRSPVTPNTKLDTEYDEQLIGRQSTTDNTRQQSM